MLDTLFEIEKSVLLFKYKLTYAERIAICSCYLSIFASG